MENADVSDMIGVQLKMPGRAIFNFSPSLYYHYLIFFSSYTFIFYDSLLQSNKQRKMNFSNTNMLTRLKYIFFIYSFYPITPLQ